MGQRLQLDITRMLSDVVGVDHGVSRDAIEEAWPKVEAILQGLEARRSSGELKFLNLPDDRESAERILEFADKAKSRFRNVVVLGIGGSSSGGVALQSALKPHYWNHLPDDQRDGLRLFVPDNADPELLSAVMDVCPPEETLYNVITKSGRTAETIATYFSILTPLKERLKDEYSSHLVFTTDPSKGQLRQIARGEGITTFSIPPGVGGRYSVLTAVGLLPAALVGIDIMRVLDGAADQRERIFNRDLLANPSAAYALLQYLAHTKRGKGIHVMMPYANALKPTADWFKQLWAESLGKKLDLGNKTVHCGPTPVAALGATDQHSQMQLYVEGPYDKTFTFILPKEFRQDVTIGRHHEDTESSQYLAEKSMSRLMLSEAEATQHALTAAQRPNMAIKLDDISPETVGELLYLLEAATITAGGLYEVNPLDQPGVEAGKVASYALMGRSGYEDILAEIEKERSREPLIIE